MITRNEDKVVIYINNYIDWDQFNQLYDSEWMEKGIRNANAIAYKLGPALTRATTHRLKVARKEGRKRKEIIERRKAEPMAAKRRRARGVISLSSEKENESNIGDDMNLDQANVEYPLQL